MMNNSSRVYRVYILPGLVFQSVMIGGGYGTGREIVEFFTRFGLLGGLLGLGLVMVCFAVLLAVSYEFARVFQAYDYRRFFRELLGKGWIIFEVLYLMMFAIVLAVIAAAAGSLFEEHLHIPGLAGIGVLLLTVAILAFYGKKWVTRILAYKALFLTAVFLVYFILIATRSGQQIVAEVARGEIAEGWLTGAFRYVLYSSVVVPAMLFVIPGIRTRGEAVASGLISAFSGMIPGVLLHLSFAVGYPEVLQQSIPAYWMIVKLGVQALVVAYIIVLFGCLLDTGICFIQSVNERLDGWLKEVNRPPIPRSTRAGIAIVCMVVSGALSFFGVVQLIAKGYGTMAWGFLVMYVAPLMTWGIYKLSRGNSTVAAPIQQPASQ